MNDENKNIPLSKAALKRKLTKLIGKLSEADRETLHAAIWRISPREMGRMIREEATKTV